MKLEINKKNENKNKIIPHSKILWKDIFLLNGNLDHKIS